MHRRKWISSSHGWKRKGRGGRQTSICEETQHADKVTIVSTENSRVDTAKHVQESLMLPLREVLRYRKEKLTMHLAMVTFSLEHQLQYTITTNFPLPTSFLQTGVLVALRKCRRLVDR